MKPIYDNVDFLLGLTADQKRAGRGAHELMDQGLLETEPLSYIRGRSIPNQFMVIDESQNLTPHEIKTIITRAGEGTRIILTGDPFQIDHPYIDVSNNGLVHAVNAFADSHLAAHITLQKGERSELAEEAARELEQRLLAVSAHKTEISDIAYGQADALVGFAEEQRELLLIAFARGGESSEVGARILERLAAGVSARRRELAAQGLRDPAFDPDILAQAIVGMWAQVLVWWAEDPRRARRDDVIRTMTQFQLFGSRHEAMDLCGQDASAPTDFQPHTPDGDASQ